MNKSNRALQNAIWLFPLVAAAPLGLDICIPGTTTIAESLHSSLGMTQWLISGFILCLSLGQLVFGPLVDRFGSQSIFILGCALYASGSAAVHFADNISALIALRLIQGIGASAFAVSVFASVPKLFTGAAVGKVFSLFNGVISLVPVLAPIIGGALIVQYGWQASFYFLFVFVLLCFVFVLFKPLPSKQENKKLQFTSICSGYLEVMRHSDFKLGCVASSCGFASQLIFFSSSPIVIIQQFGVPVDKFGFYFAVDAVTITAGSLLVSRLLGKIKESTILLCGAGSLFLASLTFIVTSQLLGEALSVWGYIVPTMIGSFGFALLMGVGASLAISPFKQISGTASALLAAVQMTFASFVAWIVIQFWTPDWLIMILSYFILALGIILAVEINRRQLLVELQNM